MTPDQQAYGAVLILILLMLLGVNALAHRVGSQRAPMAPDATLPPGVGPRNGWELEWAAPEYPGLGLVILHQSFEHLAAKSSPGSLMLRWWSWQATLILGPRTVTLIRWRERVTSTLSHSRS